jgi:hypothetical protein
LLATGSGGYVKSYGEFVEYLLRKDPGIVPLQMDFEGKNILLYHLGGRLPLADPAQVMPHICQGVAMPEMWWALSSNQGVEGGTRCAGCGRKEGTTSTSTSRRKERRKNGDRSSPAAVAEGGRNDSGRQRAVEERLLGGMKWLLTSTSTAVPGSEDGAGADY